MNKKRYWLRGLLIGAFVLVLFFIFLDIGVGSCFSDIMYSPLLPDTKAVLQKPKLGCSIFYEIFGIFNMASGLLTFAVIFSPIIGLFVGGLYGKLKKNHDSQRSS